MADENFVVCFSVVKELSHNYFKALFTVVLRSSTSKQGVHGCYRADNDSFGTTLRVSCISVLDLYQNVLVAPPEMVLLKMFELRARI